MPRDKKYYLGKGLQLFYFFVMMLPLLVLFFYPTEKTIIDPALYSRAVVNTFFLVCGVLVLATTTGLSLALCLHFYKFHFKSIIHILILLPLAFPAYVLGFIYIGLLGSHSYFYFLNPQGELYFLIIVLSFSLTPYVYYFSLLGLKYVTQSEVETELILNRGWSSFFRYNIFPKIFPFLLSSQILLIFEALADFGAASVVNVPVITTLIYKSWFDLFSFSGAVLLSLKYSFVIVLILLVEYLFKRKNEVETSLSREPVRAFKLNKLSQCFLLTSLFLYILFSILIPLGQILCWAFMSLETHFVFDILKSSVWTLLIGVGVGLLCVCLSFSLSLFIRLTREKKLYWLSISTVGYSLPGSLLAVSTYAIILFLTKNLSQSLLILCLVMALTYKFITVSLRTISESIDNIPKELDEVSALFSSSLKDRIFTYFLPYSKDSLIIALLLVMMEVMKEMPLTLMLSPSRYQTLSNKIFTFTSEGEWVKASLPSLILILVGFFSVYLIHSRENHS